MKRNFLAYYNSVRVLSMIKEEKELARYVVLNYTDKFLVFLLPLAVLFVSGDRNIYNDIEYVYSIANLIIPFFLFISTYSFYGYKKISSPNDCKSYIKDYDFFCSFTILLSLLLGSILIVIINRINTFLSQYLLFFVLIRFVNLEFTNYYGAYYRLIDKPSRLLFFSIICSLISLFFATICSILGRGVLFAYFLPQLFLSLIFIRMVLICRHNKELLRRYYNYVRESVIFSWPLIINCTIVAIVVNYGKVYAYNFMSSYEMYNFSYIMRISIIVQMAHASLMAFYGKKLYLNGYDMPFCKRYVIIITTALILSLVSLYVFNMFSTENKLRIDLTALIVLLYTFIHCCGAATEVYFGRNNRNRIVLYLSLFSSVIYGLLLLLFDKTILLFSVSMVAYSLIYFISLIVYIFYSKK